MTTVLNGLLGGLVVGAVASGVLRLAGEGLSAAVLGEPGGDALAAHPWVRPLLELLYGTAAGGLFVALELTVLGVLSVPPTASEALAVGGLWGAVLLAALGLVLRVLGAAPTDPGAVRVLLAYHLLYGVGLGAWIRLTWLT